MSRSARVYGGQTAEERRRGRRRQLIEAAMAIWAEEGWPAVTMRRVCAEARLTDRYFYESFEDRDALLLAVWDSLRDDTVALIMAATFADDDATAAERLRVTIATFVRSFEADPRRARILFAEHSGSEALAGLMRATLRQFTELFVQLARPYLLPDADESRLRMSTLMGLGGFLALLSARTDGVVNVNTDEFIEHTTSVGADLAARYLRPEALHLRVPVPPSK